MKYTIKIHSIVDVITNSSTEIFSVKSDKEIEIIISIIEGAWKQKLKQEDEEYRKSYKGWMDDYLEIKKISDKKIQITSGLNAPNWLNRFIWENFNVIGKPL